MMRWTPRFVYNGIDFTLTYPVTRWKPGGRSVGQGARTATNIVANVVSRQSRSIAFTLRFTEDEWWAYVRDFIRWVQRGYPFTWYLNDIASFGSIPSYEMIAEAPRMADTITATRDPVMPWIMTLPLLLRRADGGIWDREYFKDVPPVLDTITPASGVQTQTISVVLAGSGFAEGAAIVASGFGISVQNIVVVSDAEITADFVLDAAATVGDHTITVVLNGGTSNGLVFTVIEAVPPEPPFYEKIQMGISIV